jgi:hypothetical protein
MVRGARGCAGTEIVRQVHRALATDILLCLLAGLALREAGDRSRDAVGNPMYDAQPECI